MKLHINAKLLIGLSTTAAALCFAAAASAAVNADDAEYLARSNNCFKCHRVSGPKKDGPDYKDVAAKYKGKPDAEAKLIHHITSGEMAKFPDGHSEHHKIIKTDPPHDMNQIKNLVDWILAQ